MSLPCLDRLWCMMDTEDRLQRYREADSWPVAESLAAMLDSQMAAYFAVRQALEPLSHAALAAAERLNGDLGRIVYTGAGASARLAVQDGVELVPTFGWPRDRLDYAIAGGEDALIRSVEGAEDSGDGGISAMRDMSIGPSDVLIAVAASGRTPYTNAAVRTARDAGALTIALACNSPAPLLAEAECPIAIATGAEFLSGSTRMIAGTAQKMALNLLSTQIMMQLGGIYDGLMVEVQPTNAKLVRRQLGILAMLTGCTEADAQDRLAQASGDLKLAVLLLDGLPLGEARDKLDQAKRHLRVVRGR